jgi:hypothetical protein
MLRHLIAAVIILTAGGSSSAIAVEQDQWQGHFRQPPPQAFQICAGKQAGDTVEITPPNREPVQAICTESPSGLFARPQHRHHRGWIGTGSRAETEQPR